jgi:hypothetical protein
MERYKDKCEVNECENRQSHLNLCESCGRQVCDDCILPGTCAECE